MLLRGDGAFIVVLPTSYFTRFFNPSSHQNVNGSSAIPLLTLSFAKYIFSFRQIFATEKEEAVQTQGHEEGEGSSPAQREGGRELRHVL